jgi:hypothetical protein
MIVNAAVFTCSICGEASSNICSYCTKDACSNHRCERCKRCSDCCECEVPLSAEDAVPEAEIALPVVEVPQVETAPSGFLTLEESSVFVAGSVPLEQMEPSETIEPDTIEPDDLASYDDPPEPRE